MKYEIYLLLLELPPTIDQTIKLLLHEINNPIIKTYQTLEKKAMVEVWKYNPRLENPLGFHFIFICSQNKDKIKKNHS